MIFKVCGMREQENIELLQSVRPDWMGLIFYPKSPRFVVSPLSLSHISSRKVGVFVDADRETIHQRIREYKLDGVQLHGKETPELCKHFLDQELIVVKAFSVGHTFDFSRLIPFEGYCSYYLFDTQGAVPGGTGQTFDWKILKSYDLQTPFLLSGGIGPDSVPALKQFQHPKWVGLDVNSQFEESPGIKNISKVQQFKDELFGRR